MAAQALIQFPFMGNWRQIQGRIRRARTSVDPVSKLNELFQKTRDAMVAFEAGVLEEKNRRSDEAIRWYTIAAQRFRRADWRQKAAEALARLGAPVPAPNAPEANTSSAEAQDHQAAGQDEYQETAESHPYTNNSIEAAPSAEPQPHAFVASGAVPRESEPAKRTHRRRGRRGGRRHRRADSRNLPASTQTHTHGRATTPLRPVQQAANPPVVREDETTALPAERATENAGPAPARFVLEPAGPFVERVTYIRAGDPALASRFAHLESLLRRLISAPLHRMDEMEDVPAGPGVFLLSDSDLMTNYYVEACQTLRIATGQLARSGRAGRGARAEGKPSLRSQLAEHLEITETHVSDYLKKHCVLRWLQLDEDASRLAHFAIALLRPALNTD